MWKNLAGPTTLRKEFPSRSTTWADFALINTTRLSLSSCCWADTLMPEAQTSTAGSNSRRMEPQKFILFQHLVNQSFMCKIAIPEERVYGDVGGVDSLVDEVVYGLL